jgi:hypothetical protein
MATSSNASTDLTLRNLSGLSLRRGDRDADHIWGGSARPTQAGTPVTELQTALITLGTLNNADGTFGPDTEEALRRFQWYVAHLHFRLNPLPGAAPASGTIVPFTASPGGPPGVCDAVTANLILSWLADNFVTTSPLVRLNVDLLSNIAVGEGFQQLDYPEAKKGEVLVHADFAQAVSGTMNQEANKAGVVLHLNQTFRREGVPPAGAVVPPATRSQHLVGHAVDLNIVDGSTVNTNRLFQSGDQTENANKFIAAVKKRGLRWGGDFSTADFVHFDDFLNPNGQDYDNTFFFAQRCFEHHHPILLAN